MITRNNKNRISRRRFVGAAAALVTPYVVPSAVRGRSGDTPPSERVTLGFIGTGGRGTANMRSFLPLAGGGRYVLFGRGPPWGPFQS